MQSEKIKLQSQYIEFNNENRFVAPLGSYQKTDIKLTSDEIPEYSIYNRFLLWYWQNYIIKISIRKKKKTAIDQSHDQYLPVDEQNIEFVNINRLLKNNEKFTILKFFYDPIFLSDIHLFFRRKWKQDVLRHRCNGFRQFYHRIMKYELVTKIREAGFGVTSTRLLIFYSFDLVSFNIDYFIAKSSLKKIGYQFIFCAIKKVAR